MQSLSLFVSENLSGLAEKITSSDIRLGLNLGVKYSEVLEKFIERNYEITNFSISDNGVCKKVLLETSEGIKSIELYEDFLEGNKIKIEENFISYDNFVDFRKKLKSYEKQKV